MSDCGAVSNSYFKMLKCPWRQWPSFYEDNVLILVEYQLNMFLQGFGARIFVFSFFL